MECVNRGTRASAAGDPEASWRSNTWKAGVLWALLTQHLLRMGSRTSPVASCDCLWDYEVYKTHYTQPAPHNSIHRRAYYIILFSLAGIPTRHGHPTYQKYGRWPG
nr:hypothetical protein Q903MT_gene4984 [Picea sitchensis]